MTPTARAYLGRLARIAARPFRQVGWRIGRPLRAVRWAWQRACRGWADCDVWGLDDYLDRVLAGSLRHLAATAHGWPACDEFPTFDSWQTALLKAADAFEERTRSGWEWIPGDPREIAHEAALTWIAAHWESLWD